MEQPELLRSKLYRPRGAAEPIHRTHALEVLNRNHDRAITLICAPAGFGKTTLLTDWLDACPATSAWLSLDEHDSDLGQFLAYFLAAIHTAFPEACSNTTELLRGPVLPPVDALATTLINDLDRLADDGVAPGDGTASASALPGGQRFILVLDDYHLVRGQEVHGLLTALLRHPPRTLHLVVSTRMDPPFPLHALRGSGGLAELRTPELRFTREEIATFMQRALGAPLDADALATIAERSEGWVTGLRLAALAISARGELPGDQPGSAADNRYVLEYLLKEVLAAIPVATQDFLLKTSILDRLCGPLCDAVAGPAAPNWSGREYLNWLAEQNLFTFYLDAQGTWYRYHHLFRTLLRARLERLHSAAEIAELHSRASAWLAENGLIEEAIRHALAIGDETAAVRLVEAHRHEAMNRERWTELETWLSLFPRHVVDGQAELLLLEAWLLEQKWRHADIPAYLARITALLEEASGAGMRSEADRMRLDGEIDALRSGVAYYASDAEATRVCAERALARTPLECSFVRAYAWFYVAGARERTGDARGALEALHEALKEDRLHADAFPSRLYTGLCFAYWMSTDFPNLLLTATQLLQVARQRDLKEAMAWAHYYLGCAFYQLNQLAEAEDEFGAVASQRSTAHSLAFSNSGFGLASVFAARGAFERAKEWVDLVASHGLETDNARIMSDAEAFRAWLAIRAGSAVTAESWSAACDRSTPVAPMTTFHVAQVALARGMVLLRTPASLNQAAEVLDRLHDIAVSTQNTRYLIEVLALEALLRETRGDMPGAMTTLRDAVLLAEPGGLIRVFVDLGPRMLALLTQLSGRGVAPEYLPRLLAAFGDAPESKVVGNRVGKVLPAAGHGHKRQEGLIEPLSIRELEVVGLLGERLTNKEIAHELSISQTTVKRHTVNIYQKLAVGTRRDAVDVAVSLGLLPPPQAIHYRAQRGL